MGSRHRERVPPDIAQFLEEEASRTKTRSTAAARELALARHAAHERGLRLRELELRLIRLEFAETHQAT